MADDDKKTEETTTDAQITGAPAANDAGAGTAGGTPVGGAADQNTGPAAGVLAQYVKDFSFENPNAPASLSNITSVRPKLDMNVNINASRISEEVYEVELKLNVKASYPTQDNPEDPPVSFIAELAYANLLGARGLTDEQLRPFLLITGPNLMFPFARRIIADASRDGGFPALMLDPINFEALYRQQLAQAQNAEASADANAAATAPASTAVN